MGTIGGVRFRLLTGRLAAEDAEAMRRRDGALDALRVLDRHLGAAGPFLAGDRCTIADIAVYGYAHVAGEAGVDTEPFPAFAAWLDRVAAEPGHMNDLERYPPNARRSTDER